MTMVACASASLEHEHMTMCSQRNRAHCAQRGKAQDRIRLLNSTTCSLSLPVSSRSVICERRRKLQAGQSAALEVPTLQCGISEHHDLVKLGLTVDWRGKLVEPEGVIDSEGYVPLRRRPAGGLGSAQSAELRV